jgi:uncharacterized protein YkwD
MKSRSLVFTVPALILTALLLAAGASPAAAACENADALAGTVSKGAQAKAVHCLINEERESRGLKALKRNKALAEAAKKHSKVEDKTDCISHQCPGEDALGDRVNAAGYPGCNCNWSVGEVIGWRKGDDATPRGIVDAWMNSSEHKANLLTKSRRHIGVGVVYGAPRKIDQKTPAAITTVIVGSTG